MPSWLWRDWLGPTGRGPRGLFGRRPRRRLLLPPPPEGLPGPAFIVLSKPAGPGFDPVQGCKPHRVSGSPFGCGGLSQCWRTANFLAGPIHLTQSLPSTIKSRDRAPGGMTNSSCGIACWGWRNRERNRDPLLSGEANSYWRKNFLNFAYSVIRCRNPSRRRERPGTRRAYAGTWPMRTT
jgi:hypothetical protein